MPTSVRLDADIEKRLDKIAKETGRSKAFYIREMIANSIEDIEDLYRAEQVMQRVRRGEEKIYTLDEVSAELGLDN